MADYGSRARVPARSRRPSAPAAVRAASQLCPFLGAGRAAPGRSSCSDCEALDRVVGSKAKSRQEEKRELCSEVFWVGWGLSSWNSSQNR